MSPQPKKAILGTVNRCCIPSASRYQAAALSRLWTFTEIWPMRESPNAVSSAMGAPYLSGLSDDGFHSCLVIGIRHPGLFPMPLYYRPGGPGVEHLERANGGELRGGRPRGRDSLQSRQGVVADAGKRPGRVEADVGVAVVQRLRKRLRRRRSLRAESADGLRGELPVSLARVILEERQQGGQGRLAFGSHAREVLEREVLVEAARRG